MVAVAFENEPWARNQASGTSYEEAVHLWHAFFANEIAGCAANPGGHIFTIGDDAM
jgi:hypothetical protein